MGNVDIDLRSARFTSRETVIRAFAFWGAVNVYVNAHTRVVVDGVGIMGAFDQARDKVDAQIGPDSPVVRVTGASLMARRHRRTATDAGRGQAAASARPLTWPSSSGTPTSGTSGRRTTRTPTGTTCSSCTPRESLGDPDLRHRNARVGRAVSDDLVYWELREDPLPEAAGIDDLAQWTGCVVRDRDAVVAVHERALPVRRRRPPAHRLGDLDRPAHLEPDGAHPRGRPALVPARRRPDGVARPLGGPGRRRALAHVRLGPRRERRARLRRGGARGLPRTSAGGRCCLR